MHASIRSEGNALLQEAQMYVPFVPEISTAGRFNKYGVPRCPLHILPRWSLSPSCASQSFSAQQGFISEAGSFSSRSRQDSFCQKRAIPFLGCPHRKDYRSSGSTFYIGYPLFMEPSIMFALATAALCCNYCLNYAHCCCSRMATLRVSILDILANVLVAGFSLYRSIALNFLGPAR